LEESYDALLQNAVEFETSVAQLASGQRLGISSFPDEHDIELRLINRRLMNFLATARAFVDSVKARFSEAGPSLPDGLEALEAFFSEQFDTSFSYRLMEALRNHTQHRASAIAQNLSITRSWRHVSGDSMRQLSVNPQVDRDALVNDKKVRRATSIEIATTCEDMIDIVPPLREYVRCLGVVADKAREYFAPQYESARASHSSILKAHIEGEWDAAWITPRNDPLRKEVIFAGWHELRRLERIRLRNTIFDPEAA
jgi:hypothetical protein